MPMATTTRPDRAARPGSTPRAVWRACLAAVLLGGACLGLTGPAQATDPNAMPQGTQEQQLAKLLLHQVADVDVRAWLDALLQKRAQVAEWLTANKLDSTVVETDTPSVVCRTVS